jgi:excisionase family DNA binding protein
LEPLAVDVREAGRLTSLSPRTIRRHIKSGRIRGVRIGRRLLVPIDALRELTSPDPIGQDDYRQGGESNAERAKIAVRE